MAKKEVTITIKMSELLYDIENRTYLKGRSKPDIKPAQRSYMQADKEDDNRNQLLRSIGNAFGTLTGELAEYLVESASSGSNDLRPEEDLVIVLHMPMNFNEAVVSTISEAMHYYIVCTAVSEWYELTSPDDVKAYTLQALNCFKTVQDNIHKRVRPERGTHE